MENEKCPHRGSVGGALIEAAVGFSGLPRFSAPVYMRVRVFGCACSCVCVCEPVGRLRVRVEREDPSGRRGSCTPHAPTWRCVLIPD